MSSDNIKVRVLDRTHSTPRVEFVPIERLAIKRRTLEDQQKESAKKAFAANVKNYQQDVNGLTGTRTGSSSFPADVATSYRQRRSGTLDSSKQPGLSSFPTEGEDSEEPKETNEAAAVVELPESETFRIWSDATGRFSVEARFVKQKEDLLYLERKDGKSLKIPMSKLSSGDLDYLKKRKEELEAENPFEIVKSDGAETNLMVEPESSRAVKNNTRPKKRSGKLVLDFSKPLQNVSRVDDLGWGPACVAISANKKFLVIGRNGSEVSICDVKTGQILRSSGRMDHMGSITAAGFSPDSKFLVIGGDRGVVEVYSIGSKGKLKLENQFAPHSQKITSISFSVNGKNVLTGGEDKEARL